MPKDSTPQSALFPIHHSRYFLIAFYFMAVVWGVRHIAHWDASPIDFLMPFTMAILIAWWIIVDARKRRHPIPLLSRAWVLCFALYGLPLYLLFSRGWRGILILVINAAFWCVIVLGLAHASTFMSPQHRFR